MKAKKRTKRSLLLDQLDSVLSDIRSAESALEDAIDDNEEYDDGDDSPPLIAAVAEAARRLWPDFDYRATNRFVPEDALIEAIRDLEQYG